MKSILIRGGTICGIDQETDGPLRGDALGQMKSIENAYLFIEDGMIHSFGPAEEAPERADLIIDGEGRLILPCWCDSHTHLVFAKSREQEFVDRIRGLSYEEIARRGGGILNSAAATQQASEDDLYESSFMRLNEVIRFGTGAIEIKSGYGLTVESELKMLRVIRRLKESGPIPVKATFLGAHALPQEYKNNREGYLRLIIDEMLPLIATEGLADYIDVFCEHGFFTTDEAARIMESGARYNLKPKIHVNQLSNSGGVQIGIRHKALSVDHLEQVGEEEIDLLGRAETISTLLPSCAFFLGLSYPPARKLIQAGSAIALATDYNPGSTPSGKMPIVLSLACVKMQMTPEEAFNAATYNGACAMELQDGYGSIQSGKHAHLILTKQVPGLSYLPYAFGSDHLEKVVLGEEVIDC